MATTCAGWPKCIPICNFCHYFDDSKSRKENGVNVTGAGYCRFHNEPRDLTGQCDEFYCFNLPPPKGKP